MNHANTCANRGTAASIRTLTGISILAAIVVVLTILCNFIRFGPFSITLALAPIIIGSAVYGSKAGGILGATFGLVVLITGMMGLDGGTVMYLFSQNAIATVLICLVKGWASGAFSGLIYRLIARKNDKVAVVAAGIVCPVVNTGLFIVLMMVFFFSVLNSWAGGENLIYYLIFGLTGINFLVELGVNLVLSSAIVRIIKVVSK